MAGLLYKELIINKKNILVICGACLFLSFYLFIPISLENNDIAWSIYKLGMMALCVLFFLITGSLQQGIFSADENQKWSSYIVSTPVSIKGQVLSKYYFSLLISIATLIFCAFFYGINAVIQGMDSGVMSIAVMMFILQTFMRAVEFPFLIRFGSKTGNNYRLVVFFCAFFIIFVYLLFGDLSVFGTFDGFMNWITKLISGQTFSDAVLVVIAVIPFATGILYYFSYRLSCRLYMKGVQNYDK